MKLLPSLAFFWSDALVQATEQRLIDAHDGAALNADAIHLRADKPNSIGQHGRILA